MATSFLQQARQRKIVYFATIVALFTLSLIHREFYLKPQAFAMQLRETARGEVELTSSAVRLMLTGSRGLAVTILWYNAMDKQKRNEWHELELLVKSITKLQPYFVTPWLYQSWNLSFNVAVECDRPRDKYYYISRGIELLAEGERRNRGVGDEHAAADPNKIVFPGHPELRHFMGFYYQLKIGTSDERLTMRSLIEMSCIDPVERNPAKFWTTNDRNEQVVKLEEFARFTQAHPRLVRRLREQLGLSDPARIVRFLEVNQNVPNRFKKSDLAKGTQSELKDPLDQFPLLPPAEGDSPDPRKYDLTAEAVDVFLICRTWFQFAQQPLPPPNDKPGLISPDYNKMRFRVPKHMVIQLFRAYPARAQTYIAESLEAEGFFDNTGWVVADWFEDVAGKRGGEFLNADGELEVGTDPKYHSGRAWERAFQEYKTFGEKNGIYFSPALVRELTQKAELARKQLKLAPGQVPQVRPREWFAGEKGESLDSHLRLHYNQVYRNMSNFDAFYDQTDGERSPITVYARKLIFVAERRRKVLADETCLKLYEQAWPLYIRACLEHPKFAQVTSMQEDLCEIHTRYVRISQDVRRKQFTAAALWSAKLSAGPLTTSWPDAMVRSYLIFKAEEQPEQQVKVIPFPERRGLLDTVHYYDTPSAMELRESLFLLTQGAQMAMTSNVAAAIAPPGQHYYLLSRTGFSGPPPFLLSMPIDVVRKMENGEYANCRQELKKRNIPFSDTLVLVPLQEGTTWRLHDNGLFFSYLVVNERDRVSVYGPEWRPLITDESRRVVAERPGMKR